MKINIDKEGLELLQWTEEPEQTQDTKTHVVDTKTHVADTKTHVADTKTHVVDKRPDWYKRGTARLKQEEKVKNRILLPTNASDGLGAAIYWFVLPLTHIVVCSALEMAGWNMGGVAVLSLAIIVGIGVWLYNYLIAYPEDVGAVILRIILFTLANGLGVFLVAVL